MALRNAVKVALVSESEEPPSQARLERPAPRLEQRVPPPAPAVIAAAPSNSESLADALLWWVKEQLWVSEQPAAAASEPEPAVEPIEVPAVNAPSPIDAAPAIEVTPAIEVLPPLPIEPPEVAVVELPAPLGPAPATDAQPVAETAPSDETPAPIEVLAPIEAPGAAETPPEPAAIVESTTEPRPEPVVVTQIEADAENPAAPWRARAAETRAMAATLPERSTALVIAKIAAFYDELAVEETRAEKAAPLQRPWPRLPPDRNSAARR